VALESEERPHDAILGERSLALECRQEEGHEDGPARGAALVDAIVEEEELHQRGFALRVLDPDRHAALIEQSATRHKIARTAGLRFDSLLGMNENSTPARCGSYR